VPPRPSSVLPSRIRGIYRLSHREIIDDVADIEHQVASVPNYPVSLTFRRRCEMKGVSVDEIMEAARCPNKKPSEKPGTLESLRRDVINHRAEAAKLEREIASQEAEQVALSKQYEILRQAYTKSVRNSEANRVKYQSSVLSLREKLWRETSRTAETSGKLEELRIIKQELDACDSREAQFIVEIESTQMQIELLKEIAEKTTRGVGNEVNTLLKQSAARQRMQFEKLKRELKSSQQETLYASQDLEEASKKYENLQMEIEGQTKTNNELTTSFKMSQKNLEHLKSQNKKLESKCKQFEDRRGSQKDLIGSIMARNQALKEVVAIAERRVRESASCVKSSSVELEKIRKEVEEKQGECAEIWTTTCKQRAKCEEASKRLNFLKRKTDNHYSRSRSTLLKAARRKRQLEGDLEKSETRLKLARSKMESLDKELKEIETEFKNSKNKLQKQTAESFEQVASNSEALLQHAEKHLSKTQNSSTTSKDL